jgi:predicted nuclease of restriction endonuclease-like (RecB) superfamily
MKKEKILIPSKSGELEKNYDSMFQGVLNLIEEARRTSVRTINSIMTATYWEIGRRIVQFEQKGSDRAEYGKEVIKKLSFDLTVRAGRGFGVANISQMRKFYINWNEEKILQKASVKFENYDTGEDGAIKISQKPSVNFGLKDMAQLFPLPWSHYVRLLWVKNPNAREFYEIEALRGGWSEPQLDRQISSMFYERTALSKNKSAMLKKGAKPLEGEILSPEQEIKSPVILEFLTLKNEYSENDLEEAIIHKLEAFLLELGTDFTFVGRQKRLRIDDSWYKVDLVFYHRRLRCLVLIDLKLGKFTYADSGQMHTYLNYAKENWTNEGENPPVGLILCAEKGHDLAKYALEGLPNKIMAAEYQTLLPDEKALVVEIEKTRNLFERRKGNMKNNQVKKLK